MSAFDIWSRVGARLLKLAAAAALGAALGACGGGGGGGSGSSAAAATGPTSSLAAVPASLTDANVVAIYLSSGPAGSSAFVPNTMFADVKVCAPGSTTNCAVIDHLIVDTGSVGLRLISSVVPPTLLSALPATASNGGIAAECTAFASGVTWGSLRTADLRIGGSNYSGELASSLPIEIIGDSDARLATIPSSCLSQGSLMQTVASLNANGILGAGLWKQDCGATCALSAPAVYYGCPSAGNCAQTAMPTASQIANPISFFTGDNNGNAITFASLPSGSATRADGMMVLGIGTRTNNGLAASSSILGVNAYGYFTASLNGNTLPNSFIDSGSTVTFMPTTGSTTIAECTGGLAGFLCPASTLTLTDNNTGRSATSSSAPLTVVNAANSFASAPSASVYAGLTAKTAASNGSLDLGASFFIGRTVTTLIENGTASGFAIQGPAFAHTP